MAESCSSDWQKTKRTVLERNAFMFGNSLMSDVLFVFTSEQTRETFPAHKYVLSTASPVFFAMFYGEMKEENEVQIKEVSFKAFEKFLRFLYTDETNLDGDSVMEVLYLARKHTVPSLVEKCSEFLDKNINEKNALVLLEQGIKYDETGIIEKCYKDIERGIKAIVETDEFLKISHEMLCRLLQREVMAIKEVDFFQAVDKWAIEQCKLKDLSSDGDNKREVLGEALNLIRFDCMDQEDFEKKVLEKGVLTSDEVSKIEHSRQDEEKLESRKRRDPWMGLDKSTILANNMSYLKQLLEWLDNTPTKGLKWDMCFNAKRDGFGAGTFHNRCDNKNNTVTIVQVDDYIFGGYADVPWSSPDNGSHSKSSTCWIFSLKNADNRPAFQTLSTKRPDTAIYSQSNYGPSFGIGSDIFICDEADAIDNSYTNFGLTYNPPQGYVSDDNTPLMKTFLAGSYRFTVTNYEVFCTA